MIDLDNDTILCPFCGILIFAESITVKSSQFNCWGCRRLFNLKHSIIQLQILNENNLTYDFYKVRKLIAISTKLNDPFDCNKFYVEYTNE